MFHKADEPLEVDSWFRTIESKFTLHPYNDGDKAGFAAQQLRGPARTWWDNHMAMFPEGTSHPSRGDQKKTHGVLAPEVG